VSVQQITTPYGISVFGSSTINVVPDMATLVCGLTKTAVTPKDAFQAARESAHAVREFLNAQSIMDSGSSNITLQEAYDHVNGKSTFVGYTARIDFRVTLSDLNLIESIVSGVIDSGANKIHRVDFQTSQLKTLRAQARREAIVAAREKALNYCEAANVRLGTVLHIEDVNPDLLRGNESHAGGIRTTQAFEPGFIQVGGAVIVAYKLHEN